MLIAGKNAVLAWRVDSGTYAGAKLDGLGVVAVVSARETLGLKQAASGKAIVIVDEKATPEQRDALVAFVKSQTGSLTKDIVAVESAPIDTLEPATEPIPSATPKPADAQGAKAPAGKAHYEALRPGPALGSGRPRGENLARALLPRV